MARYLQLGWAALLSGIRFLHCSGLRAQWRQLGSLSRKAISYSVAHWGRLCRSHPVTYSKRKLIALVPFGSPCHMETANKRVEPDLRERALLARSGPSNSGSDRRKGLIVIDNLIK